MTLPQHDPLPASHSEKGEQTQSLSATKGTQRRTLITAAAWAAPALIVSGALPAYASSAATLTCSPSAVSGQAGTLLPAITIFYRRGTTPVTSTVVSLSLSNGFTFTTGSSTAGVVTGQAGTAVVPSIRLPNTPGQATLTVSSGGVTTAVRITCTPAPVVPVPVTGTIAWDTPADVSGVQGWNVTVSGRITLTGGTMPATVTLTATGVNTAPVPATLAVNAQGAFTLPALALSQVGDLTLVASVPGTEISPSAPLLLSTRSTEIIPENPTVWSVRLEGETRWTPLKPYTGMTSRAQASVVYTIPKGATRELYVWGPTITRALRTVAMPYGGTRIDSFDASLSIKTEKKWGGELRTSVITAKNASTAGYIFFDYPASSSTPGPNVPVGIVGITVV